MKFDNAFSLKDFLNYYFPGFVWLAVGISVVLPFGPESLFRDTVSRIQQSTSMIGDSVWLTILVIAPYLVGFILNPIGGFATRSLKRSFGDPSKWVLVPKTKHFGIYALSKKEVNDIKIGVEQLFGYKEVEKLSVHFFRVRAYVAHYSSGAYGLALRAQDLANFAESMLVPTVTLLWILGLRIYSYSNGIGIAFAIIGLAVLLLLSRQYLKFQAHWIRHLYRAFLVLEASAARSRRLSV